MGFSGNLRCKIPEPPMSAMGQKQTSQPVLVMSALPLKADIAKHCWDVCFVPKANIERPRLSAGYWQNRHDLHGISWKDRKVRMALE